MNPRISSIEYHLPEHVLTSAGLAAEIAGWSVVKIQSKTGIEERHIAGVEEFGSGLAVRAAEKIYAGGVPAEKFVVSMQKCGNTVSSTMPIALKLALESGLLKPGMKVMPSALALGTLGAAISWSGRSEMR